MAVNGDASLRTTYHGVAVGGEGGAVRRAQGDKRRDHAAVTKCPTLKKNSALRRCRLPGLGDAFTFHLVHLPVGVLVFLRAVPLCLARCAVTRRLIRTGRQPAL